MNNSFALTNEGAPAAKKADPKAFRPIKSIKSDDLMEQMAMHLENLIEVIRNTDRSAFANGVTDPLGTYDQGQMWTMDIVNKAENTLSLYKGQLATITPAQFRGAWLEAGLPSFSTMSADRKRHLLARSKETFFVENWDAGLYIAVNSDFCMGKNDRRWKANPDWFLRPGTLAKLMEGRYGKVETHRLEPANMVTSEESLNDAVATWKMNQDFFTQDE